MFPKEQSHYVRQSRAHIGSICTYVPDTHEWPGVRVLTAGEHAWTAYIRGEKTLVLTEWQSCRDLSYCPPTEPTGWNLNPEHNGFRDVALCMGFLPLQEETERWQFVLFPVTLKATAPQCDRQTSVSHEESCHKSTACWQLAPGSLLPILCNGYSI